MNAALNRPALNMTILVSVIFHLAVLYYLATTWNIIPPMSSQPPEPPSVPIYRPEPPPPVIQPDTPIHPKIVPRAPIVRDTPTTVDPIPLPPNPTTPSPDGPMVIDHPPPP